MDILSSIADPFSSLNPQFISTILGASLALFIFFKFMASLFAAKKLAPGSLGYPLVGETISFIRAQKKDQTQQWILNRVEKYGPVFKTSILGSKMVVVTGQAGNRFVFGGGDNGLSLNQPASVVKVLGKNSLFEMSGSRHKLVRGAIVNFLKPESIQRYAARMDSLVQHQLLKELHGKDSTEIVPLMKKITFNVTCSILFGLPDGTEKDELLNDFTLTVKGVWGIPLDFPGTMFHRAMQARRRLCRKLSEMVTSRKNQEDVGTVEPMDDNIVSCLLALRDEDGQPLSGDEIVDVFLSLIMASHDTTAVLLTLFIRHLARDAEVSNKVLQEQNEVLKAIKRNGGKLTWSEIQMMRYTWRAAQELMRVNPPMLGSFRLVTKDITFDGHHIPKGWQVFWVAPGTHMDSNIFEDPEKFDPSRFEGSSKAFPPYTYVPFGAGPRICAGIEFARVESLLMIHHLVTKYSWTEMVPDEPIVRAPMPYPAMGLPVKLYPKI
ncbi:cytochrome P450, family 716, subfamily A, polypeptide 1 [Hibiscus trionum]|uniref:Cytochrome P450, family 716, subfamily A, polypeptide 1 n=1 Tax=Hibiscus trionum TaxID=183268 RepID=A0A9W7JLI0_HIBTR|nr:cytochrome P450, family 716, subfamily A, polypeptide 1 [Hibiscus trionum]